MLIVLFTLDELSHMLLLGLYLTLQMKYYVSLAGLLLLV